MSIARRLKAYLDENQVPYTHCVHRLAYTAQEVAAAQHVSGREMAKTVVFEGDGRFFLVVLPAVMKVDVEALRAELPYRSIRLAGEGEFASAFPDSEPGAMPPFGNLYELPVYVEESLARDEEIVFNAGTHVETIRMKYEDFERLVRPQPVRAGIPAHLS
jgi:Ala-tRNA(Pro) deacylase